MLTLLYASLAIANQPEHTVLGSEPLAEEPDNKPKKNKDSGTEGSAKQAPQQQEIGQQSTEQVSEKLKTPTSFSPNPKLFAGLETGAALSTTELRAAFLPVWHVGIQLPYWKERLGFLFHGSYHVSKLEATGDTQMMTTGTYSYSLRQQEAVFGFNTRVRIPEVPVVTPEIWLGPTVELLGTTLEGKSGDAFPTTSEQETRIGLHAALLGDFTLPVGSLFGGIHINSFSHQSTIQGNVRNASISPTIGFRYTFF